MRSIFSLVRIRMLRFEARLRRRGVNAEQVGRGPMKVTSDMTSSSRIGSIGGLVTCAKQLAEIVVKRLGFVRKHRQGSVVAH